MGGASTGVAGEHADEVLGLHFAVDFLEHVVELAEFAFGNKKMYGVAWGRDDDTADVGILHGDMVFFFLGDDKGKYLVVVGAEGKHGGAETNLEVIAALAVYDVSVVVDEPTFKMAHG